MSSERKPEMERRYSTGEIQIAEIRKTGDVVVEGHAAVFKRLSEDLGGFREEIVPGAFRDVLADSATDVRALHNHELSRLLGRQSSGTLELREDSTGLYYRVQLPATSYAQDLRALLERNDVRESSFAFRVADEDFRREDGVFIRSVRTVGRLFDVSIVTFPAYVETDASVAKRHLDLWRKRDPGPRLQAARRRLALIEKVSDS